MRRRSCSAAVTAGAADCASAPDFVTAPLTAHLAVFEPSACAISATRFEAWLGSRQRPAAPLEPSPSAIGGAVSSQVLGLLQRQRWKQESGYCWTHWWLG